MTAPDLEALADEFKRQSGKPFHWSDCATSRAPAEMPGPCDCASPWYPMNSAPRDGTEILIGGGTFNDDNDWTSTDYPFAGVAIVRFIDGAWQGEANHSHDDYRWHEPEFWMALPPLPGSAS